MKRKKVVKIVWIVISLMVVISMLSWTVSMSFHVIFVTQAYYSKKVANIGYFLFHQGQSIFFVVLLL